MAFAIKIDKNRSNTGNRFIQKKDRFVCTHCGYLGHTIDKCYKLHGYPPGYKPRQKCHYNNNTTNSTSQVNQVSESPMVSGNNFVQMLNHSPYSQFLSMLSSHLKEAKLDDNSASTSVKGTCLSVPANTTLLSIKCWIVDSGATSHICYCKYAFTSLKLVQDVYVTLPDRSKMHVYFIGYVKLSSHLVIQDVLYVHQFRFNLMSVSALTKSSLLSVLFLISSYIF